MTSVSLTEIVCNFPHSLEASGAHGGAVDGGPALQAGRSWVGFPIVSLDFFIDIILLWCEIRLIRKLYVEQRVKV